MVITNHLYKYNVFTSMFPFFLWIGRICQSKCLALIFLFAQDCWADAVNQESSLHPSYVRRTDALLVFITCSQFQQNNVAHDLITLFLFQKESIPLRPLDVSFPGVTQWEKKVTGQTRLPISNAPDQNYCSQAKTVLW